MSDDVPPTWLDQVKRRIAINEGSRTSRYFDSVGVPTIGIGFNLQRADAAQLLERAGVADAAGAIAGTVTLTDAQMSRLFALSFAPILSEARASVTHWDHLAPARAFVICDLVYNLGAAGWNQFGGTRQLLDAATVATLPALVHALYDHAADHLEESAWYGQTGDRAKRNVAMMRSSTWCDPCGDGRS